jgi:uncharacterized protein YcaQ
VTPVPLSLAEARRIALAAQGFHLRRPAGNVLARHLQDTIQRLGLVQLDYVNVLVPAHYQVPFSRLGRYDRRLFDRVVYGGREYTEQWAHEASLVPIDTWPLLRHRMDEQRVRPKEFADFLTRESRYVEQVLDHVRERGPLTVEDLPPPDGAITRLPGDWYGSVARAVVEAFLSRGVLAVTGRRPNFAREYDLAERAIPGEHFRRVVAREDAQRELVRRAARALGVATASDLTDYYRMNIHDTRSRVAELVESGDLLPVAVEGWRDPSYLHAAAASPSPISASTLLSPFDPLIWTRPRAERLFGFHYRVEIYVPEAERRWGYYVLPFLLGERLVGRVDLKADRRNRRLLVMAAHAESGVDVGEVADALVAELREWASWLDLESVQVGRRGNLSRFVRAALGPKKRLTRS